MVCKVCVSRCIPETRVEKYTVCVQRSVPYQATRTVCVCVPVEECYTATRMAVKDAVVELLTDPELRTKLHHASAPLDGAASPQAASRPSLLSRLLGGVKAAIVAVRRAFVGAGHAIASRVRTMTSSSYDCSDVRTPAASIASIGVARRSTRSTLGRL